MYGLLLVDLIFLVSIYCGGGCFFCCDGLILFGWLVRMKGGCEIGLGFVMIVEEYEIGFFLGWFWECWDWDVGK